MIQKSHKQNKRDIEIVKHFLKSWESYDNPKKLDKDVLFNKLLKALGLVSIFDDKYMTEATGARFLDSKQSASSLQKKKLGVSCVSLSDIKQKEAELKTHTPIKLGTLLSSGDVCPKQQWWEEYSKQNPDQVEMYTDFTMQFIGAKIPKNPTFILANRESVQIPEGDSENTILVISEEDKKTKYKEWKGPLLVLSGKKEEGHPPKSIYRPTDRRLAIHMFIKEHSKIETALICDDNIESLNVDLTEETYNEFLKTAKEELNDSTEKNRALIETINLELTRLDKPEDDAPLRSKELKLMLKIESLLFNKDLLTLPTKNQAKSRQHKQTPGRKVVFLNAQATREKGKDSLLEGPAPFPTHSHTFFEDMYMAWIATYKGIHARSSYLSVTKLRSDEKDSAKSVLQEGFALKDIEQLAQPKQNTADHTFAIQMIAASYRHTQKKQWSQVFKRNTVWGLLPKPIRSKITDIQTNVYKEGSKEAALKHAYQTYSTSLMQHSNLWNMEVGEPIKTLELGNVKTEEDFQKNIKKIEISATIDNAFCKAIDIYFMSGKEDAAEAEAEEPPTKRTRIESPTTEDTYFSEKYRKQGSQLQSRWKSDSSMTITPLLEEILCEVVPSPSKNDRFYDQLYALQTLVDQLEKPKSSEKTSVPLFKAATGFGKSVVMTALLRYWMIRKGGNVSVCSPQIKLSDQLSSTIQRSGLSVTDIHSKAQSNHDFTSFIKEHKLTGFISGSITQSTSGNYDFDKNTLVLIDEAHVDRNAAFLKFLQENKVPFLCVTATPKPVKKLLEKTGLTSKKMGPSRSNSILSDVILGVQTCIVDNTGKENMDFIKGNIDPVNRTIVFCSTIKEANEYSTELKKEDDYKEKCFVMHSGSDSDSNALVDFNKCKGSAVLFIVEQGKLGVDYKPATQEILPVGTIIVSPEKKSCLDHNLKQLLGRVSRNFGVEGLIPKLIIAKSKVLTEPRSFSKQKFYYHSGTNRWIFIINKKGQYIDYEELIDGRVQKNRTNLNIRDYTLFNQPFHLKGASTLHMSLYNWFTVPDKDLPSIPNKIKKLSLFQVIINKLRFGQKVASDLEKLLTNLSEQRHEPSEDLTQFKSLLGRNIPKVKAFEEDYTEIGIPILKGESTSTSSSDEEVPTALTSRRNDTKRDEQRLARQQIAERKINDNIKNTCLIYTPSNPNTFSINLKSDFSL
ncbi:DEAD/DEAH box helicase family protein, partial [bacterium]|nr:DEAD/DEAH box helicase family protein [bacterium]